MAYRRNTKHYKLQIYDTLYPDYPIYIEDFTKHKFDRCRDFLLDILTDELTIKNNKELLPYPALRNLFDKFLLTQHYSPNEAYKLKGKVLDTSVIRIDITNVRKETIKNNLL